MVTNNQVAEFLLHFFQELRLVQGSGPYNICGYSGGGTVAFEMAKILENEYKEQVRSTINYPAKNSQLHEICVPP